MSYVPRHSPTAYYKDKWFPERFPLHYRAMPNIAVEYDETHSSVPMIYPSSNNRKCWDMVHANLSNLVNAASEYKSVSENIDELIFVMAPAFFWGYSQLFEAYRIQGTYPLTRLHSNACTFFQDLFKHLAKQPPFNDKNSLLGQALARIAKPEVMKQIFKIVEQRKRAENVNVGRPETTARLCQSTGPENLRSDIKQDLIQKMQKRLKEIQTKIQTTLRAPGFKHSRWLCCIEYINKLMDLSTFDASDDCSPDEQLTKLQQIFHNLISICYFMFEVKQDTHFNPKYASRIGTDLYQQFQSLKTLIESSPLADSFYHWLPDEQTKHLVDEALTHCNQSIETRVTNLREDPDSDPKSIEEKISQMSNTSEAFTSHIREKQSYSIQGIIVGDNNKVASFADTISRWMEKILKICYKFLHSETSSNNTDEKLSEEASFSP